MRRPKLLPSTLPVSPPPHPAAAWIAWRRRPGEHWVRVGGGRTLQEAWDALSRAMDRERVGTFDSAILKRGVEP
jgi:hypothetical protein